jgi:hypothetical protein
MREGYTQTAVLLKRFNLQSVLARSAAGASGMTPVAQPSSIAAPGARRSPSKLMKRFNWSNLEEHGMDVELNGSCTG